MNKTTSVFPRPALAAVLALLAGLLMASELRAQTVPGLINYQGRLNDAAGMPVNASVPMTFALFNSLAAGSTLWSESQTVSVTNGLYSVMMGNSVAIPSSVVSGATVYLQVKVMSQTLTPRQRLVTAPYAFKSQLAADSSLLNGQAPTYYRDAANINAGTLGTGYYSAYSDLTAEGYLDGNSSTDVLLRSQADARFVNEGQADSITSAMAQFNYAGSASEGGIANDSDLLDGQHGSFYVTKDGDTMTGPLSAPTLRVHTLTTSGDTTGDFPATTNTSGTTPFQTPGRRTQTLYLASELPPGLITGLEIELTSGATVTLNNLRVTLGATSLTALTTTYAGNYSSSTIVRQPANLTIGPRSADTFVSIPLDRTYYWDGSSNLVVEYNFSTASATVIARYNSTGYTSRFLLGSYNAVTGAVYNYLHHHRITISSGIKAKRLSVGEINFGDVTKVPLDQTTWNDLSDGGTTSLHTHDLSSLTGTLGTGSYSAYADLTAEGYLDNSAAGDILTQTQSDGRFVNTTGDDSMAGSLTIGGDLSITGNNIGIGQLSNASYGIINNSALPPTYGARLFGTSEGVRGAYSTSPADHYAYLGSVGYGVYAVCGNSAENAARYGGRFASNSLNTSYAVYALSNGYGASSSIAVNGVSYGNSTGMAMGAQFSAQAGKGNRYGVAGYGYSQTGYTAYGIYGYASGTGTNYGIYNAAGTKNWVNPDPEDPGKSIVYSTIEAGENNTLFRGRARLQKGRAVITLPDHFRKATNPELPVTVTATPREDCNGLMTIASNNAAIEVKELQRGTSNAEFDFIVIGIRLGYEEYKPVIENVDYVPFQNNLAGMDESAMTTQDFYDNQSEGMKRIFKANGTLDKNGKINEAKFKEKGWKLTKERKPKADAP